jgi:hypothetical protein
MADEPVSGAAAGGAEGGAPAGMSAEEIAAPGGDIAFLEQDIPATDSAETKGTEAAGKEGGAEETKGAEEIDLSSLEEGQPAWLAKLDEKDRAEAEKALKAGTGLPDNWQFKDEADREEFFKSLPGGREQVTALQTLAQEISADDTALEANDPEGLAAIAEKYVGMTPDGGIGLMRAAAAHMAKANPEAWQQIAGELINSTLQAAGFGFDLPGLVGAIRDIKAAIQADDGDAWGAAVGKLLGAPKAKESGDAAKTQDPQAAIRAEAQKAQTDAWQMRSEKSGKAVDGHLTKLTDEALSKVLPASISEKDRGTLRGDIAGEVMSQILSDAWIVSQVTQLIGVSNRTAKGGFDYSKANLKAGQGEWDRATEIITKYATPKMIARAVSKVVGKWSKDRAAANTAARDKARGTVTRKDVGGGTPTKTNNGRRILTEDMLRGPNALTDEEILNL